MGRMSYNNGIIMTISKSKTSACCLLALAGLVGYRALVFGRVVVASNIAHSIEPSSFRMDELLLGRELLSISILSASKNTLHNNNNVREEPLSPWQQSMPSMDKESQQQQQQRKQQAYVPSLGRNVTLPLPIVLYPFVVEGSKGEQAMQICENGVRESPYVNLTTLHDFHPDVVWLLDTSKNLKRFCATFTRQVETVQALRAQQGLPTSWPIHLFDNGDEPIVRECKSLENLIGPKYYHYHKRSIVQNRYWDDATNWIHFGEKLVVPPPPAAMMANRNEEISLEPSSAPRSISSSSKPAINNNFNRFHHVNIPVRADMVLAIAHYVDTKYNHLKIHDDLERVLPRPIDVAHFWPSNKQNMTQFFSKSNNNNNNNTPNSNNKRKRINMQVQDGFLVQSSNLRDTVGLVLDNLDGSLLLEEPNDSNGTAVTTTTTTTTRKITTFAGAQGRGRKLGRSTVQEAYLETLMSTKIHVVAQRDEWEDHFRLLEALVSGAMVMTDEMLTLPAGLEDSVSLIVYHSADDLAKKIQCYLSRPQERLAIARAGRRIAMSRHRVQHRIEEMMFEKWPRHPKAEVE